MTTYRVIRYYRFEAGGLNTNPPEVTHRGLTEEQALRIVGEGINEMTGAPYFYVYQAE